MQLHEPIILRLPADGKWVRVAVAAAGEYALRLGFSKEGARRICLALEEAVMDAIAFGYGSQRDELRVTYSRAAHGMHLAVRSQGIPLEEALLPRYDPSRLEEGDVTGLGAHLIRGLMDQASFSIMESGEREVSMLLLPLDSPHTPNLCEAAEGLGFFFSGIGPGQQGRMHLGLQFLHGTESGFEAIQVHTPFARELLEYVRSCALEA